MSTRNLFSLPPILLLLTLPAAAKGNEDPPEIPLDFRKLESSAARSLDAVEKPSSRLPEGLGLKERERPSRDEPPAPGNDSAVEPRSRDGVESAPVESRRGGSDDRNRDDRNRGDRDDRNRGDRDDHNRDDRRRGRPGYDLYEEASRASSWAAEWQVRRYGLPAYYRVGVWQGVRDALERASRRSFAFERGQDEGESDPRARRTGEQAGERAALERGEQAAIAEVEREFRDLAHEPRRSPRTPNEPLPPNLVRVRAPRPEDAFADSPISSYLGYENLDSLPDPWQLYRYSSWREAYDTNWASDKQAFAYWLERGNSALWERLSRPESDYFRRTFIKELDYWRTRYLRSRADNAYREGYDDGWEYGSRVGAEMRYREGYYQGFLSAATAAAEDTWDEVYAQTFGRVYREVFAEWAGSPRPEILNAELFDHNDDGIFEPGEEVRIEVEVANYGGADVRLELGADGNAIEPAAAARPLALRRRSVAHGEVRILIDKAQAPRTNTSFLVRAGNVNKTVPILISRPLEIDGRVTFSRLSALEGRATFEVGVWNRSRLPAAGSLDVLLGARRIPGQSLEVLAPQSRRQISLEVAEIDALDLLEGGTELRLELRNRDGVQDALRQRLPALGLDPQSSELVDFWLEAVYGRRRLDRADVDRTIELITRRLAADWEVQRAASGNPYKDDLERGGTRTALGELVAACTREGRPRRPELNQALEARLAALIDELPGTHPFLRGAFKKLAAKLS